MSNVYNNPWKGVVPYTENDPHPFCGRDKDVEELLEVVEYNNVSTLYGRSGIGKTSLLNAGLFPRLKDSGYYPISIRLDTDCTYEDNYASHIIGRLAPFAQLQNGTIWPPLNDDAKESLRYLWLFFAYHRFYFEGDEIIPVIVLDQFEEILRHNKENASLLLNQLSALLQDGTLEDGTEYTIGFRFIISLREDDLYLLEDCLDERNITLLKHGRYRLRPIDYETAKNEIILASSNLFDAADDEKEEIARDIIEASTQDKQISTILLSLICSMIYEKSQPGKITIDKVKQVTASNPLLTFYQESIADIPVCFPEIA